MSRSVSFSRTEALARQFGYRYELPSDICGSWRGVIDLSEFVQGNTFTMYLDNAKFPTIQVCDDTYKSGGIAIRYRVYPGDLRGYITNLTVKEIASGSDVRAP